VTDWDRSASPAGVGILERECDSPFQYTLRFSLVEYRQDSGEVEDRRRFHGRVRLLYLATDFGQKLFQHRYSLSFHGGV
jgi:hypothetical protein